MKNLAHISTETLDALPEKLSPRWKVRDGLPRYRRYRPNNVAWCRVANRLEKIIQGSVGQDWNDIHSKLCAIIKHVPFDFQMEWATHSVVFPYWSTKEERWKYMYRYGWETDLEHHLDSLKRRTSNSVEYFYYVCPISGKLRLAKSNKWKYTKEDRLWMIRRHYGYLKDKRKSRKKEIVPEVWYSLINKPELFKFYTSLKDNYKEHIKAFKKGLLQIPKKANKNYLERWAAHEHNQRFTRAEIELESLKNQIDRLEGGDFDGFYQSAAYLYAQQKECHHFAQP